jgi:two-component system phosphate regulon response regulator PhoB
MSKTILAVVPEHSIADFIGLNGKDANYNVLHASDAAQALDSVEASLPDLALLHWSLPDMSGIELTRRLRANQRTRNLPIIMLSGRSAEHDKVSGLDSGADDFVTIPFSARELFARIKALLRQRTPQKTDETIMAGGLRLEPVTRRIIANGKWLELAPTEFRLLHFLMIRAGRILTRTQILDSVWGDNAIAEERTVDVSIRRLRKSLQEFDHQCVIDTIRGEGYRFSSPNCPEKSERAQAPAEPALSGTCNISTCGRDIRESTV